MKMTKPVINEQYGSDNALLIINGYNTWFNYTVSSNVQLRKKNEKNHSYFNSGF